ncbi:MAG: SUMF1/EgtB/PvdO family nonheme iron enzyme [Bacteroidetes bacterium]|nr:SUMF1/EgtB/PvdO family nonheme iron enzyme [Bacteroidota bacterium]
MKDLNYLINNNFIRPTGKNIQGFDTFLRIKDNSKMVLIPEGEFIAGTLIEDALNIEELVPWYKATKVESPQWKPFLERYLIDLNTITNKQFSLFLNSIKYTIFHDANLNNCRSALSGDDKILCYDIDNFINNRNIPNSEHKVGVTYLNKNWMPFPNSENCPVTLITWYGAVAYAKWVNAELPSELQWEKAARGIDGRHFPWGNEYQSSIANLADFWHGDKINNQSEWDNLFYLNGKGVGWLKSRPVENGSFPLSISPYGCEDMIGNVAEWCFNWYEDSAYQDYNLDKIDYVPKQSESEFRCMRGAGRYGYEVISRIACRRRRAPHTVGENLGFRCII